MRRISLLTPLLLLPLAYAASEAEKYWPQWRGPYHNGSTSAATGLPTTWSETENVKWKVRLPSWAAATPIIWDDTVLVTSAEEGFSTLAEQRQRTPAPAPSSRDKILLLAVNRADGAVKWQKVVGGENRVYRKQNLASPSPVTDGSHIWIMTGSGILSCLDFNGEIKWQRDIPKDYGTFGLNHGYASSPLLEGDRLYVQVLHGMKTDEPSYVFAVDKATGKTLWKVDRWTDAQNESPDDYSTPLMATVDGKQQLIVSGGDYVTGHDPESGKELWRMGGFNPNDEPFYRTIASSIVIGDVIYTPSTRGKPFIAFRAGAGDDATLWSNDLGADVPTPTTDGKRIYVINDRGIAVALDAKTGEIIWDRQRIEPGTYSASPLLADGKIYATSEDGVTTVLKAGAEFQILAVNRLDEHTLASPAAVGRQIFLRTEEHLYCFEQAP